MRPNLHRRRCFAWIAALAILLAALTPALHHGLMNHGLMNHVGATHSASRFAVMDQICSVHGTVFNPAAAAAAAAKDGSHPGAPSDDAAHFGHCAFCSASGVAVGLPPADVVPMILLAGAAMRPLLYLHAPTPLFAWSARQARAPPVYS